MNKKGFTLVELLAVIVILAIILAIAIPGISGVIESATKSAFESDAKLLLKAVDYKLAQDDSFDITTINESNVDTLLNISNSNYERLNVKKINGIIYVTIVGKGKWNNLTVAGTKESTKIEDTVTALVRGANAPALATGMTPIKWNGSAWVDTTSDDSAWYNYDTTNKIWANAKTADGSFWVWIPRYIYKISTGWHTNTAGTIDVQFSKGIDDNWNKSVIGDIDLGETASASNNKWTNHPAFTFGDTELTGIWVAKFEPFNDSLNIKIVPNEYSWRNITINNAFTRSRGMETNSVYGWGTTGTGIDTHMMKNTEWGAVAYLAQSTYGKNAEIWINPSNITGCAGDSVDSAATPDCLRAYDTANGEQASTTGNIYGIYDMSGDVREYMSSYLNNGDMHLTYGSSVISADSKYKDVYTIGSTDTQANNYTLAANKKGDAIYETSSADTGSTSWYSDYSSMARTDLPWLERGGQGSQSIAAGMFNFYRQNGDMYSYLTFRPILLVGTGL